MSSTSKRPAPPVPDPNWELELHGPVPGAWRDSPESKDELLAHAVLSEPKPLDLNDDFGDLEPGAWDTDRVTVPPPDGMADHVARMMAEAAMLESLEAEDDRPTPLSEVDQLPFEVAAKQALRSPAPGAAGPTPRAIPPALRVAPVASAPRPAPAAPRPSPQREAGSPAPRATSGSLPGATSGSLPRATPPPFAAVRPAAPAAARPVARAPTPAPMRAPSHTPPPFAVRTREPGVQAAPAQAPEGPRRISSLDLEDLPAVFSLDGLSLDGLSLDDLSTVPSVKPASPPASDPVLSSEPAISPSLALPPSSGPAISPPFASLDPMDLAAELSELEDAWVAPSSAAPPVQAPPPAEPATSEPAAETMAALEARLAAGDYGRALVLAEAALVAHPDSPALARSADMCRDELYKRYLERLGAADHVPRLAVHSGAITGLALDHRAGFLLSCVDGDSTVEEIIDVSAMPRLEAVRVLYELLQEGVIEMTARR
jgi:hypothetical protein